MHPYATDSSERVYLLGALIPISFWLASAFDRLLKAASIVWPPEAEFLADPASAAFCYWLLYLLLDKLLWKWSFLHRIGLIKIPNLNGVWQGHLKSSYDNYQTEHKASVEIEQTWTSISIRLSLPQSRSHSESATILTNAGVGKRLSYEYLSEPRVGQVQTMATHRGTTVQVLRKDGRKQILDGYYYTSHGRKNVGSVRFCQDQASRH